MRVGNGPRLLLDSPKPRMQLSDYRKGELRFSALANTDPVEAEPLKNPAQRTVRQRWQIHGEMATRSVGDPLANVRKDH